MVAGMSPLTPPPSILSIATMWPTEGGDLGVAGILMFSAVLEGRFNPRELIREAFVTCVCKCKTVS